MAANAVISTTKLNALLTRVQAHPEISTLNSTYVADLLDRAVDTAVALCRLPRYPELSQGYSKSAASGASTDISGASSNELGISVNGSGVHYVNPTLASCTTGAATATELQSVIRAVSTDWGFDEVAVTFASAAYTITSGRYGESSKVCLSFQEANKHVAQELALTPLFGGTEVRGMTDMTAVDHLTVGLVEAASVKTGAEGTVSASKLGEGSLTFADLPKELQPLIYQARRLWP